MDEFHRCRTRKDGRNVYCRQCHSVWAKAHYAKKAPEAKVVARTDTRRAAEAAWRERNREKAREACRLWRERNPGASKERIAAWAKENRDRRAANEAKRRAAKAGSEGRYTADDVAAILKAQDVRCVYCRTDVSKGYHVDHIQPLSKGGSNNPSNLQVTCPPCNLRKSNKDPADFAYQLGRLDWPPYLQEAHFGDQRV